MTAGDPAVSPPSWDSGAIGPAVRPPARSRSGVAIGAVVVLAAIVLGVLVATGVFAHAFGSGGSPGATTPPAASPVSYFQARSASEAEADQQPGGPWNLEDVYGFDSNESHSYVSISDAPWAFGCSAVGVAGASTAVTIPAYDGNTSRGLAPWWGFLYQSLSASYAVFVQVTGASSVAASSLNGTCYANALVHVAIPESVIDSPVAAAAAWNETGAAYLGAHPNATTTFALSAMTGASPGGSGLAIPDAQWQVGYDGCDPFGWNGAAQQPSVLAEVNASSGRAVGSAGGTSDCGPPSSPTPGDVGFALGPASPLIGACASGENTGASPGQSGGCFPGDATLTVALNFSLLTLGSIGVGASTCTTNLGGTFCQGVEVGATPGALAVLDGQGEVIASTPVSSGMLETASSGWELFAPGASNATALSANDSIVIDLGSGAPFLGTGVIAWFYGHGLYGGEIDDYAG
jgi:hypothetical protein